MAKKFAYMRKPRLAIVGLGQYYHKLRLGIAECFTPVLEADVAEVNAAGGELKAIVEASAPQAIMLLTPNHLHAEQVDALAELRIPTLVEKPAATTEAGLNLLLRSLETNRSLYCSDFYLDVRAVPLLDWLRRPYAKSLKKWIEIEGDSELWRQGASAIDPVRHFEAVLLEGEGQSGTFSGRDWLWDQVHGGVLWDLAYHFLVLWHGLFAEPLTLESCRTRTQPAKDKTHAETYAALEMSSSSGTKFLVRVGKYQQRGNERWLRVDGGSGAEALLVFQDPNVLRIRSGLKECVATLTGNYYFHVVEAFREYVDSGAVGPHGVEAAVSAARLIIGAKKSTYPQKVDLLQER